MILSLVDPSSGKLWGVWLPALSVRRAIRREKRPGMAASSDRKADVDVMPGPIADTDPALSRAGPVIEELTETRHLVMHADDRHLPHQRLLIQRLVKLYDETRHLLAGKRPMRG